jgi:hypothetical protein
VVRLQPIDLCKGRYGRNILQKTGWLSLAQVCRTTREEFRPLRTATVDIVVRLSKSMSHAGNFLRQLSHDTAITLILRKDRIYDETEPILTFLCELLGRENIKILIESDGTKFPIKVVHDNYSTAMQSFFPEFQPGTHDTVIAFTWEHEGQAPLSGRW